jgi:hypothetical protein
MLLPYATNSDATKTRVTAALYCVNWVGFGTGQMKRGGGKGQCGDTKVSTITPQPQAPPKVSIPHAVDAFPGDRAEGYSTTQHPQHK